MTEKKLQFKFSSYLNKIKKGDKSNEENLKNKTTSAKEIERDVLNTKISEDKNTKTDIVNKLNKNDSEGQSELNTLEKKNAKTFKPSSVDIRYNNTTFKPSSVNRTHDNKLSNSLQNNSFKHTNYYSSSQQKRSTLDAPNINQQKTYNSHREPYNPHKPIYTPHKAPYNPHKAPYNPHKPTYTPQGSTRNSNFNNATSTQDIKPKRVFQNNKIKQTTLKVKKNEKSTLQKAYVKNNFFSRDDTFKKLKKRKLEKEKTKKHIIIYDKISIKDLAHKLSEKVSDLIKMLKNLISQDKLTEFHLLDSETAEILVSELGHTYEFQKDIYNIDIKIKNIQLELQDKINLEMRPPIISVVGHVDHGKTSLLDLIQNTATKEHGDITQSVRTFSIQEKKNNSTFTFIDTPGHAILSNLRTSSIQASDIIILLISIEDGIKEQTIESIKAAKSKKIIVAINKIDKVNEEEKRNKIRKIEEDLVKYEILTLNMGGDIPVCEISILKKIGIDKLYETILLISEETNLFFSTECQAFGKILDSNLNKHQGISASMVLQQGLLKKGDYIVTPTTYGRVKTINKNDQELKAGYAATVYKLDNFAKTNESFITVKSEREAKNIISYYKEKDKKPEIKTEISLEQLLLNKTTEENTKKLNFIIKSDAFGTLDAIEQEILKIKPSNISIDIINKSIGEITNSDLESAKYFKAKIISFNFKNNNLIKQLANKEGITIVEFKIIYHILDYIKEEIESSTDKVIEKEVTAQAKIKAIFSFTAKKVIAGCDILSGIFKKSSLIQVIRNNKMIADNLKIKSMMIEKEEVEEGRKKQEVGFLIHNFDDFQKDDIFESYDIKK